MSDAETGRPAETARALRRRIAELEELEVRHARMEVALRDSEQRYRFLYEENPSMYFTMDTDGVVLSVNPFGASQLGYSVEELVGKPVVQVFHPEDRDSVRKQFRTCVDHPGQVFGWELRKIRKDGAQMWVRELARAARDAEGRINVLIICEDITDRRSVERELRQAKDELERRVVERTAELERQRKYLRQVIDVDPNFIFAKDGEGRFTLVNQAVADAYGTTVEELTGKRDADFNPNPEQVETFRQMDRQVMNTLEERFIAEESITDSTGKIRWLQTVKRPLADDSGKVTQVLGSATDITARRDAQEALRRSESALRQSQRELRLLAGRLLTAQEDERRLLAREMHDDFTQRLAALAMQAGRLERESALRSSDAPQRMREIRTSLAQLSADVHAFSRRLHPAILEDLGLIDAIEAECSAVTQAGEITVRFRNSELAGEIDKSLALCIYRITQEALRNVVKHARAEEARVHLEEQDGALLLTVEDDGVGFDAGVASGIGLGLASMGERARLVQAELTIESTPGQGSVVRVRAPRRPRPL